MNELLPERAVSTGKDWPTLLTLAANAGLIAWLWNRIPTTVAVHWNLQGEVDRYGGRFEALALVPLILLAVIGVMWVAQRLTPNNGAVMRVVRIGLALFGLTFTAQYALGWTPERAVLVGLGFFFVLLGNVMGKVQPSPWVGFRTRWTFLSKRAWHQSQRRSGVFLVCYGLLSLVVGLLIPGAWLFPWVMPLAFMLTLFGGLGWLTYLSYLDYRQDPDPEPIRSVRG
ncbi:DUF1648 domain-containing protein [Deinococcus psychrotolerans]|uniref:DUF1648 domain-containing protein n=1 Tax=Deinococcus psychrotolerans TaxID=2489213 RepID=A0A3G8YKH5_9DEIO|nr:DUF1648 domain-containing protein [Deinococcus psychrotolerans]AZI42021.1 DUF1648 domain-containing protein [Deinococcus psychrotolerans]